MKINETSTETPTINFNSLSNGTVFKVSDEGPYYMKTDRIFPMEFGVVYNAVKLENGEMCGVARDREVIVFLEASMTPGKPAGTV
jgi:hypothetical protein